MSKEDTLNGHLAQLQAENLELASECESLIQGKREQERETGSLKEAKERLEKSLEATLARLEEEVGKGRELQ
jgi:hypothetical protein